MFDSVRNIFDSSISRPLHTPLLGKKDVHVWSASLDCCPHGVESLSETISKEERRRAERFRFEKDKNHFIIARGTLRRLLAGYLGGAPHEVPITYNRYGKPMIDPNLESSIRFSVSHSGDNAVFAFAYGREVGIDLENIRSNYSGQDIAEKVFSPHERLLWNSISQGMRSAAFFNIWTQKEAFLKAIGTGISFHLREVTVPLTLEGPIASDCTIGDDIQRKWTFMRLLCDPRYEIALVVEGTPAKVQCFTLPAEQNQSEHTTNLGNVGLGKGAYVLTSC